MSNHVIETIGHWGVKTSPVATRVKCVRAGDVVQFTEEHRHYPVSYAHCRVASVNKATGMVSLVDGMGSCFITEQATMDISGGPFFSLPIECLEPTHCLHTVTVWNWGDHIPGAAQGVDYHIDRPLFRATATPRDFETRYSRNGEDDARQGGEYRHNCIDPSWELVRSWDDHDGMTAYLFKRA